MSAFSEYRRARAVNWSTLKEMRESPAHYRYRLTHPLKDTPAMAFGRAVHCAVLEPDDFPRRYVLWDGGRRYGKAWEEFRAVNAGREPLIAEDYERCLEVRDAVHANRDARRLLAKGRSEVTLAWVDPLTRMRCKGRIDHLRGGALTELKTTASTDARTFGRLAARYGYIEQQAFYRMGLAASGVTPGPVHIIAVESEDVHDVYVAEIDDDALWAGGEIVAELLARVKECRRKRRWPGRTEGVQTLDVPPWYFESQDDDELALVGLKAKVP